MHFDPTRTVVLPMHGDVEVSEAGHLQGGRPCLPADRDDRWISLEPIAVATLVEWVAQSGRSAAKCTGEYGVFFEHPARRQRPDLQ